MRRKARQRKVFSEELKRKAVKDIEQSKASIAQVCREYGVSDVSVYRWLNKYSSYLQKGARLVVELNSEGYRSKELEKKVKELEAAVGRKQLEIDFLEKLIQIAEQELSIDIKKKIIHQTLEWFRANRGTGRYKMKMLHQITGISRQALHQYNHRHAQRFVEEVLVCEQARAIRERHPRMGCRTMYDLMKDIPMGRDRCEQILLANGFGVKRVKNYFKTTDAQLVFHIPNLIKGLTIKAINELWQTDITYYHVPCGPVYYLVFIIDVYSRRIVGHCAHDHMRAEANLFCLRRAFAVRQGDDLRGLIHHSDRGSQHIEWHYRQALKEKGIRMSMCLTAQENAYCERINGIIKNDYLKSKEITKLGQFRKELDKSVKAYNEERPHHSLPGRMSPIQFENYLKNTPRHLHPTFTIYEK